MKFPLPMRIPAGLQPVLTQAFGVSDNVLEPEGPNGEPHYHYGIDLVFGTPDERYGADLVCPFPVSNYDGYLQPGTGREGTPFVQLSYVDTAGIKYEVVLAHISEMESAKRFIYGDTIAKMGNFGLVAPAPTPERPHDGTHLHLGLKVNDEWVNPALYFDMTQWFTKGTDVHPPLTPATLGVIEEILNIIKSLLNNGK